MVSLFTVNFKFLYLKVFSQESARRHTLITEELQKFVAAQVLTSPDKLLTSEVMIFHRKFMVTILLQQRSLFRKCIALHGNTFIMPICLRVPYCNLSANFW